MIQVLLSLKATGRIPGERETEIGEIHQIEQNLKSSCQRTDFEIRSNDQRNRERSGSRRTLISSESSHRGHLPKMI
ncbi:hypothetical protein CULT_840037 [[Clostridium] ultunense Esp]|nr:hypothetical protein CULT_840037 [[Clostridium] ultunense Esp]